MRVLLLIWVIGLVSINKLYGQAEPARKDVGSAISFGGQVMISANDGDLFYNMGGGGITLKNRTMAGSINFLPSLRYNFNTEKVTPVLGIGPQIHIRERLLIGMPVYYLENSWKVSFGIGYKFQFGCAQ